MIHAFRNGENADREVFLCGIGSASCMAETATDCTGRRSIGWIQQGQAMCSVVNGRDKLWDEWQFVPALVTEDAAPVRESYVAAREDARIYAQAVLSGSAVL